MRVIAGSARSLPLRSLKGSTTRPTTDRIKETLFNIIADRIPDARFLDLFAGSGGIGIEALSRGAAMAVFVEQDRSALQVIRYNLHFTRLEERAKVVAGDAVRAVCGPASSVDGGHSFDVIFMDPPYDKGLERRVLEALMDSPAADEDTLIIIEASSETDFSYLDELNYEMLREKSYGSNRHVFVRKKHAELDRTD